TGFGPWGQGRNLQGALASNEDDGPPIDRGGAQGSKPEQSSAEKMVSDQSASKMEDSKGVEGEPNREKMPASFVVLGLRPERAWPAMLGPTCASG
ncbi:unnamed protein product, partial [Staurois parvus]